MSESGQQRNPSYKELTVQQLRSLVETSRRGSQVAAARELGLAQATVWEQLHALQRELGAELIRGHGRGSSLTPDGELLVRLCGPIITSLDQLPEMFHQRLGNAEQILRVAATPRTLMEDLPPSIVKFEQKYPAVKLDLYELDDDDVWRYVEQGLVDVGFTPRTADDAAGKWINFRIAYELDQFLVTPLDHPLARKRRVSPEDILEFPLVNGPGTFFGERLLAIESQLESSAAPARRVAAFTVATIRKFVKLGFGIGIVPRLSSPSAGDPELHERSMSKYFGRVPSHIVTKRGGDNELAELFLSYVQRRL